MFAHFGMQLERITHGRSFLESDLSDSLILGTRPERITHGCSVLVSALSDLLTLLIFGERPERFAHIAHQKRGNEQIVHFLNKKKCI